MKSALAQEVSKLKTAVKSSNITKSGKKTQR